MNETISLLITLLLWGAVFFALFWYLAKKCYVPYEPNKIRIIMYGDDYYSAMIGTRGYKIDPKNRNIVVDPDNKAKRSLWGLLPGILIFYPFFKVKSDIKLFITEKKSPHLIKRGEDGDIVLSENSNTAIVLREIITDYILFENTYYFAIKELETGNDYLKSTDDSKSEILDFAGIEDPEIKKFTEQINQLIKASLLIQGQIKDLENIDVEMVLGDVVRITNVWGYLFQQKDWFSITESLLKSAIRELCAEKTYTQLLTMQSSTSEVFIYKNKKPISLAVHLTKRQKALSLGHESKTVLLEEFGLGAKSKPIEEAIQKIQTTKRSLTEEIFTTIKDFTKLNLMQRKISLVKNAILEIKSKENATEKAKWNSIGGVSSKITHFYESSTGKPETEDVALFSKLLSIVDEKSSKKES